MDGVCGEASSATQENASVSIRARIILLRSSSSLLPQWTVTKKRTPQQSPAEICSTSAKVPISSQITICGDRVRTACSIAAGFGCPQMTSQHSPTFRSGSPPCMAEISYRSSITVTFRQGPASPEERLLHRSRRMVVFPEPGGPAMIPPTKGSTLRISSSAAPRISRETRMFKEEMFRKVTSPSRSKTALAQIPTRSPQAVVINPFRISCSWVCTVYPQRRTKQSCSIWQSMTVPQGLSDNLPESANKFCLPSKTETGRPTRSRISWIRFRS